MKILSKSIYGTEFSPADLDNVLWSMMSGSDMTAIFDARAIVIIMNESDLVLKLI